MSYTVKFEVFCFTKWAMIILNIFQDLLPARTSLIQSTIIYS